MTSIYANLNSLFKNYLEENNKIWVWKNLTKTYTASLLLDNFLLWLWYFKLRNDISIYDVNNLIIYNIKFNKKYEWIKENNYKKINSCIGYFFDFYEKNKDIIDNIVYKIKKQKIFDTDKVWKNNEKILLENFIKYIDDDNWINWEKFRKNIEYIFTIMKKEELTLLISLFQEWSKNLHNLREYGNNNENINFFDESYKYIYNKLINIYWNKDLVWEHSIIKSLYGKYLNFIKLQNNLKNTLWKNFVKTKLVVDTTKIEEYKILDDLDSHEINPFLNKPWENVVYYTNWDVWVPDWSELLWDIPRLDPQYNTFWQYEIPYDD